jgi:hypothetical protein
MNDNILKCPGFWKNFKIAPLLDFFCTGIKIHNFKKDGFILYDEILFLK